jgi:hydrogenase expression/formation protein HypC
VVQWLDRTEPFSRALVEFDGVRREVAMGCVPDAQEGEYVIVHAGAAISRLSAAEAESLLADLARIAGADEEFGAAAP